MLPAQWEPKPRGMLEGGPWAGGRPLEEPGGLRTAVRTPSLLPSEGRKISITGLRHLGHSSRLHQCPESLAQSHSPWPAGPHPGDKRTGPGRRGRGQGATKLPIRRHLTSGPSEEGHGARGPSGHHRARVRLPLLGRCPLRAESNKRALAGGKDLLIPVVTGSAEGKEAGTQGPAVRASSVPHRWGLSASLAQDKLQRGAGSTC